MNGWSRSEEIMVVLFLILAWAATVKVLYTVYIHITGGG